MFLCLLALNRQLMNIAKYLFVLYFPVLQQHLFLVVILCSFCLRHQATVKHETQAPFPPTRPVPPSDPPRKTAQHLLKEENRITSSRHWHPRADRNFNSPFSKEIAVVILALWLSLAYVD